MLTRQLHDFVLWRCRRFINMMLPSPSRKPAMYASTSGLSVPISPAPSADPPGDGMCRSGNVEYPEGARKVATCSRRSDAPGTGAAVYCPVAMACRRDRSLALPSVRLLPLRDHAMRQLLGPAQAPVEPARRLHTGELRIEHPQQRVLDLGCPMALEARPRLAGEQRAHLLGVVLALETIGGGHLNGPSHSGRQGPCPVCRRRTRPVPAAPASPHAGRSGRSSPAPRPAEPRPLRPS